MTSHRPTFGSQVASVYAALILSAGCMQPDLVTLQTAFDPNGVRWADTQGNNRLEGSALLRTRGGEIRTCAGLPVYLIPNSDYAKERMIDIYGRLSKGFNPDDSGHHPVFVNDDPRYHKHVRQTICDPQGHFEFEQLPDGAFFLTADVRWETGGRDNYQGGVLMQRLRVVGARDFKLVLTN